MTGGVHQAEMSADFVELEADRNSAAADFDISFDENRHAESRTDVTSSTTSEVSQMTTIAEETESMLLRENEGDAIQMTSGRATAAHMSMSSNGSDESTYSSCNDQTNDIDGTPAEARHPTESARGDSMTLNGSGAQQSAIIQEGESSVSSYADCDATMTDSLVEGMETEAEGSHCGCPASDIHPINPSIFIISENDGLPSSSGWWMRTVTTSRMQIIRRSKEMDVLIPELMSRLRPPLSYPG